MTTTADAPASAGGPPTGAPQRRLSRRFPGDRRVWQAAGVVAAVLLVLGAIELVRPRDFFTGTNSVTTRSVATGIPDGAALCVRNLSIPPGTGRIRLDYMGGGPRPRLDAVLTSGGRTARTSLPAGPPGTGKLDFPVARSPGGGPVPGRFCVTPRGEGAAFGGIQGLQGNDVPLTVGRSRVNARVAVWYLPPAGERRSLLTSLPDIARRAALFRPGWVGPWTYWVLLFLVTPALGYAALRLLAGRRGWAASAVAVGVLAVANAATFATLSPAFQAPDETEHIAYVQLLAETGHRPTLVPGRGAFSSEENLALEATRPLSTSETPEGRPPWEELEQARWRQRVDRTRPLGRDDGGGPTTPATHRPGYYLAAAPAYLAARGGGFFAELWASRLVSALLAGLTAAITVLFVRELFPRAPRLIPVAAGLLVAFLPQFSFVSGAVNNDAGGNAITALTLLLAVIVLRRGFSIPRAAALGLAAASIPLFKATGIAVYPAIAVALLGAVLRATPRQALLGLAAAAAGFLAGTVLLTVVDQLVTQVATAQSAGPAGVSNSAGGVLSRALDSPTLFLSYLWQTFLPRLPFMTDLFSGSISPFYGIYVRNGFASFGWYSMEFGDLVYRVVAAVAVLVVVGAAVSVWQRRHALPTKWPEVLFVVLAIAGVFGGVAAAYMQPTPHLGRPPEQGRYAFAAIPAFAAVAGAALLSLRSRWLAWAAGGLVTAMIAFQWAAQVMLLQRFYT